MEIHKTWWKIPKGKKVLKNFQEIKASGESSTRQRLEALACSSRSLRSGSPEFRAQLFPFLWAGIHSPISPAELQRILSNYEIQEAAYLQIQNKKRAPGTQIGHVHGMNMLTLIKLSPSPNPIPLMPTGGCAH